ncbi:branched-chain amino acid ABC transporter substrate-binding protein [Yinghuangia soli]|uniref:Branched-chain amino acid ABC transporter substrate-binding protein n=1 Tax=Yinghuangia soli TaxID=2908204 RepID=A0AA41PY10_9ACTN|nr:branched-chain amino acid ABC transporter substrate-binding protein [Yinghuangia soli]MCF2527480.1 branched-chain amino acid ABC transporter substrate-binding protein [Yinghuangia soli]
MHPLQSDDPAAVTGRHLSARRDEASGTAPDPARRRLIIGGALLSAAAIGGVAACSSDGTKSAAATGSAPPPAPPAAGPSEAPAAPTPTGPKPRYRIGLQAPLSGGGAAEMGANLQTGVELALKQAESTGKLTFRLELVVADDEGQGPKGPAAAKVLLDDSEVVAVVGPLFSGPAMTTGEAYGAAGLATVTPGATKHTLGTRGFTAFHRALPGDRAEGTEMAALLGGKLKATNVVVVDNKTEYADSIVEGLLEGLTSRGISHSRKTAPPGTRDFAAIATAVAKAGADAVVCVGYGPEAALLSKALDSAGFTGTRLGADAMAEKGFVSSAGSSAENWWLTVPVADAAAEPALAAFAADYERVFQKKPGIYAAEGFDIANLLIEAVKSLGNQPVTRAAVLGAVRSSRYQGLVKSYAFDRSTGEWAGTGGTFAYQVKSAKIQYVGSVAKLVAG